MPHGVEAPGRKLCLPGALRPERWMARPIMQRPVFGLSGLRRKGSPRPKPRWAECARRVLGVPQIRSKRSSGSIWPLTRGSGKRCGGETRRHSSQTHCKSRKPGIGRMLSNRRRAAPFATIIALNEHDWQMVFAQKKPKTALVTLGGLGNQTHPSQLARLDTVQIGTNRYVNLIAQLVPSSTLPSQLSQAFIRRHILTVDFPNQLLYLAPGKHFADAEEPSLSGMLPVEVAGKIVVSSVDQESPAFRAGIRQDDQIISINGEEASSLGLKPLRQLLQAKPGTELRVVVRRGRSEEH